MSAPRGTAPSGGAPCLILDPCGPYPERLLGALAARGGRAVAVFTHRGRLGIWRGRWQARLGESIVGEYLAFAAGGLDALAAEIAADWPGLTGLVAWDEDNVVPGALLGERLGLGWNPPAVIERCRDKWLLKRWLRERSEVRVNASRVVRNTGEALAFQEEVGRWPLVVKPSGGSGSENVFFAHHPGELLRGCQEVLESGAGSVLLEEYVGGRELAVNGLVDGSGRLAVTDVWLYDRRESHGVPNLFYAAEKLSTTAAELAPVADYAARVVTALGLRRAPIHAEIKVDDKGPCLIEIGARFGGISLPVLGSLLHGRDLFALALDHYLAVRDHRPDELDFAAYDAAAARVVTGIQDRELARIETVRGVDEVEALPSFAGWGLLRPEGAPAPLTRDLDSRSWEVLLYHADPAQVATDADAVRRVLYYE